MKKLIALILILVVTPFFIVTEGTLDSEALKISRKNFNNPETTNWEYVKTRLFDGETSDVYRNDNAILLVVEFASKKDSLIIQKAINDIKEILPQKNIAFFKDFVGISYEEFIKIDYNTSDKLNGYSYNYVGSSITMLSFLNKDKYGYVNSNWPGARDTYPVGDIGFIQHHFSRDKEGKRQGWPRINFETVDNTSWSDWFAGDYIRYELMRLLCEVELSDYIQEKSVYASTEHKPLECSIFDRDIFLLQKLYSDDFLEQFKEYLYVNYPWRYANSFLNKNLAKAQALIIISAIGILVFILMFGYFQNRKFKYSYLSYFLPILLILFHFINLNYIYDYLTEFNSFIGWDQNIMFMLTIVPPIGLFISLLLWAFDKWIVKENMNFTFQLVLKIVVTFIAFNFPFVLIVLFKGKGIINDYKFIEFYLPMLFMWFALALARGLLIYLNHFSESLVKEKDVELSHLRALNSQAELKTLQAQINPHFLYNSLNSIASLAYIDAERTEKMALSLSDLFKYTLNRKGKKISTVKDEVEMVQNYLEIEQTRFGDRLQFVIDVEQTVLQEEIPMFILQPLVENAVKHGISKIEGQGEIVLQILKTKKGIQIKISDNGPDFPDGLVSGHGLQTVYDLLRLSYVDKAALKWQNAPEKCILILIDKTT